VEERGAIIRRFYNSKDNIIVIIITYILGVIGLNL